MKQIRDATTVIGSLEEGELVAALSAALTDTLKKLKEHAGNRAKSSAKGKVSLTIDLDVQQSGVTITADIQAKLPKMPRRSTYFWVLDDGSLSLEHPQQMSMFSGPRATVERAPLTAEV